MKKGIKKLILYLLLSVSFTMWVFNFFDSLWGVEDQELFPFSVFGLTFFILLNLGFMPQKEKWRRWFAPLFVSGSVTLLFLVLYSYSRSSNWLAPETVFLQFFGLYIGIFVARILLRDHTAIGAFVPFVDKDKKGLALLWFSLAGISAFLTINQINLSEAASSAQIRADEAYDLSQNDDSGEAMSRAEEAQDQAERAYNLAEEALSKGHDNENDIDSLERRVRY